MRNVASWQDQLTLCRCAAGKQLDMSSLAAMEGRQAPVLLLLIVSAVALKLRASRTASGLEVLSLHLCTSVWLSPPPQTLCTHPA